MGRAGQRSAGRRGCRVRLGRTHSRAGARVSRRSASQILLSPLKPLRLQGAIYEGCRRWQADSRRGPRADRAYWSAFLGVPLARLREPGIVVASHAGLAGYRGLWLFVHGQAAVISAPPDIAQRRRARVRRCALLGSPVARVRRPRAWPRRRDDRRPVVSRLAARGEAPSDPARGRACPRELRASCGCEAPFGGVAEGWAHAGIDVDGPETLAVVDGGACWRWVSSAPMRAEASRPVCAHAPAERGGGTPHAWSARWWSARSQRISSCSIRRSWPTRPPWRSRGGRIRAVCHRARGSFEFRRRVTRAA